MAFVSVLEGVENWRRRGRDRDAQPTHGVTYGAYVTNRASGYTSRYGTLTFTAAVLEAAGIDPDGRIDVLRDGSLLLIRPGDGFRLSRLSARSRARRANSVYLHFGAESMARPVRHEVRRGEILLDLDRWPGQS